MLKLIREHAIAGLGIGYVVVTICLWIFGDVKEMKAIEVMQQYTVWMIASIFYGVVGIVYHTKSLNPVVSKVLHFVLCLAITVIAIAILGMFRFTIYVLPTFIIIYIIICIVTFIFAKIETKQINKNLQNR